MSLGYKGFVNFDKSRQSHRMQATFSKRKVSPMTCASIFAKSKSKQPSQAWDGLLCLG